MGLFRPPPGLPATAPTLGPPRKILSGGSDGVSYLWQLPNNPVAAEGDEWQLLKADGVAAVHGMTELSRRPDEAIELFARNLQFDVVETETLDQWIAELNSSDGATQQQARQDLLAVGDQALGPLQAALAAAGKDPLLTYLIKEAESSRKAESRAISLLRRMDSEKAKMLVKRRLARN